MRQGSDAWGYGKREFLRSMSILLLARGRENICVAIARRIKFVGLYILLSFTVSQRVVDMSSVRERNDE